MSKKNSKSVGMLKTTAHLGTWVQIDRSAVHPRKNQAES